MSVDMVANAMFHLKTTNINNDDSNIKDNTPKKKGNLSEWCNVVKFLSISGNTAPSGIHSGHW